MAIIAGTPYNDNLRGTDLTADMIYGGDGGDLLYGEQRTVRLYSTVTGFSSGGGYNAAVSDNGQSVVFFSLMAGPGDINGFYDIYSANVSTGQPTLVSCAADGTVATNASYGPVISGDGRFIAFSSYASNLLPGAADTNGYLDVFVKDLLTGTVERVSTDSAGAQANGSSGYVATNRKGISISSDGRFIAFSSNANNLVAGDTNGSTDIFIKDRATGETLCLSVSWVIGNQANSSSFYPMLSDDGQRAVFESGATNLVSDDTNGTNDIFMRDIAEGTNTRLSVAADGTEGNASSYAAAISRDGRFVAFCSYASNLVAGDTNGWVDLFVKNLETGEIVRANTKADGSQSETKASQDLTGVPGLSADGRFVVFASSAADLVAGDTNGATDVFVKDLVSCNIARVSISPEGVQANSNGYAPTISADGRIISWENVASTVNPLGQSGSNIVAVSNPLYSSDILAGGTGDDTYVLRTYDQVLELANEGNDTVRTDLAFYTLASNVENLQITGGVGSLGRGNGLVNVLSGGQGRDRLEGLGGNDTLKGEQGTLLVSSSSTGAKANAASGKVDLASNGQFIAFASAASNLAGRNVNGSSSDIFVKDMATHQTSLASAVTGTKRTGNNSSGDISLSISGNGRFVAFESHATDLVAGDTNGLQDVFLHDIPYNTTTRISVASDGTTQANGSCWSPVLNSSGSMAAFLSTATNLVTGDTNGSIDVFLKNISSGAMIRVSTGSGGTQANAGSFNPSISADGSLVAFDSLATNLIPADANGSNDVFLKNVNTDTTSLISVSTAGTQGNGDSFDPILTPDGQFILFQSRASNLVAGDVNGTDDIFLRDRIAGTTIRVSTAANGAQANSGAAYGDISDDGRFVVFQSLSTNLVAGDSNGCADIFVKDLLTGQIERVSVNDQGIQGNGNSLTPSISGDGRVIAFITEASNLLPNDTNGFADVVRVANPLATQDTLAGGPGNDTYEVSAQDSIVELANAGTDTIRTRLSSYTLPANVENLQYNGTGIFSGTGNSLNNTITGGNRADTLRGGTGNDILNGKLGKDRLIGGTGNDIFVFDTALNATTNRDVIVSFLAIEDTIHLDQTIFSKLSTGTLTASQLKASATGAATDADDYILYNTISGALFYDADGNGAGVATQFATLDTKPAITAADFVVIA